MSFSKMSRDLKLLIVFSGLRNITELFLGAFMVSFLMQVSTNQIISVSTYKLFEYVATTLVFFLFAGWCKRRDKVNVLRLSVLPKIVLLLSIILLGNGVAQHVLVLGLLYGFSAGMYYLPSNSMTGEKVPSNLMGYFMGTQNAVNYTAKIVFPVVLGYFIDTGSYVSVSYVLLGLSILELGLMMLLTPSRHRSKNPVDYGGFIRCAFRFPVIKKLFKMELMRGFGNGLLTSVITMYTIYMFKTDLKLGFFTTFFSLCSVFSTWCMGRFCHQRRYPIVVSVCMLLTMFGISLFVWHTTPITFLIYNFVYATAIVVMDQICKVNMFKLSKSKCVTNNHKTEFFVLRDFTLFIGRWVGCVGLMYLGVFGDYGWLRWYLVFITMTILLAGYMAIRIMLPKRKR